MNIRKIFALTLSAALLAPTAGMAQFKIPSLTGGTPAAAGGDAGAQQDALVKAYVAADKDVLLAQAKMADAVGLKERAATLQAAGDALGAGATKDSLEASETMQSEASQEIQARLQDSNLQLDEAGKKKFSSALGLLGRGTAKYAKLKEPILQFQKSITSGGVAGALGAASKLSAGKFIVTSAPKNLKNLSGTLSMATNYAKSHDIPVPADATAAL
jgi:hypothetical protein